MTPVTASDEETALIEVACHSLLEKFRKTSHKLVESLVVARVSELESPARDHSLELVVETEALYREYLRLRLLLAKR